MMRLPFIVLMVGAAGTAASSCILLWLRSVLLRATHAPVALFCLHLSRADQLLRTVLMEARISQDSLLVDRG